MKIDSDTRAAYARTEHTCRRLGMTGVDRNIFMAVFNHVRNAELSGHDLWPLWQKYMSDDPEVSAIAIAAYIEAVASTRKAVTGYAGA